jgi:hypothetical protein
MKPVVLVLALATSAALVAGCNRPQDANSGTNPAPTSSSSTAPSNSSATPPALPTAPMTPSGAGDASTGSSAPTGSSASNTGSSAGAQDSAATNPTGNLSKDEETAGMPKAGQANNHSSPAMDQSKGSTGK